MTPTPRVKIERSAFQKLVFHHFGNLLFEQGQGDGFSKGMDAILKLQNKELMRKLWRESEKFITDSIEVLRTAKDAATAFPDLETDTIARVLWERVEKGNEERKRRTYGRASEFIK